MNTDTGHIYYGDEDTKAARLRGENLVALTDEEARDLINVPPLNRAERRAQKFGHKVKR